MNGHDPNDAICPNWQFATACAFDLLFCVTQIDVERVGVAIHQNGNATVVLNDFCGRGKRVRWNEYTLARL